MKLRTKALAAAGALGAVTGVLGFAAPAAADPADCYDYPGTICLTEFVGWTGQVWRQYPSQITGCRKLARDSFDNEATTAGNFTSGSVGVYLYDRDDCTGSPSVYIPSGGRRDYSGSTFNNKASSIRVVLF